MPRKRKSVAAPASGTAKKAPRKTSSSRAPTATGSKSAADRAADITVKQAAATANSAHIHEALQAQLTKHGHQLSQSGVAYVSMSQVTCQNLSQCSQDPLEVQIQDSQELLQDSSSDESWNEKSNDSSSDESWNEKSNDKTQETSGKKVGESSDEGQDSQELLQDSSSDESLNEKSNSKTQETSGKKVGKSSDEGSAASETKSQPANVVDQPVSRSEEAVAVTQRNDQHGINEGSKGEGVRHSVKEDCDKCTFFKGELARRSAEIRRLRKKISDLNHDKAARDDHTLSLSRELQELKENRKMPSVSFTVNEAVDITLEELKAIDGQSSSDKMFVANLAIHFFGIDRLRNLSVTGKPTPRFKSQVNEDGSLAYPAREQIDPTIYKFICEKLSERVAMRLGPSKISQITFFADEKHVRKALAVKISNLNKAAEKRASQNPRH